MKQDKLDELTSIDVGSVQQSDVIAFRISHRLAVKRTALPPLEELFSIGLSVIESWCILTTDTSPESWMRSFNSRSSSLIGVTPREDAVAVALALAYLLRRGALAAGPYLSLDTAIASLTAR